DLRRRLLAAPEHRRRGGRGGGEPAGVRPPADRRHDGHREPMTLGRFGIHEVLSSVAGAMAVPGFDDVMGLPAAERYVVLVVDGMGRELLDEHADLAPFLSGLTGVEGVLSPVPSTTSVSLTSLGTGLRPGTHGMAGYTCRI